MGNDFGLGLVLSFTDNASTGIYGVVNALGTLQGQVGATSSTLERLQNTFGILSNLGATMTATITAPIAGFMGKIASYGIARASFVENTHLAFTSLMNDAQVASDYMQELMGFAKTTPYTYESITSAAQNMITYGIDQAKILTATLNETGDTIYGGILQALGDWAGATGRGEYGFAYVADIFGHISAEGKATGIRLLQLQNQGIQVSKIIGNMYDMTEAEAMQFIKTQMTAKQLIDDLIVGIEEGTDGINGATGAMAGMMSNLKNTWTGALDTFKSSLKTAGLNLMGQYIDEYGVTRYKFLETMTASLNLLSGALKKVSTVLQPIADLVQNVMQKGAQMIAKLADIYASLDEGSKKGIGAFISALVLMGPALLVVGKIMTSILPIINVLKGAFLALPKAVSSAFGLMILSASAFFLVWKYNLFNIRTLVTNFVEGVKTSLDIARNAVSGNITQMRQTLWSLDKNDFFDGLTLAFSKVLVLMTAVKEGWDDFTLSEDTFEKAKELGILPLIEAIFDLKYRFGLFKDGFIQGWKDINQKVTDFINGIKSSVDGTVFDTLFQGVSDFLDKLNENDPQAWTDLGYAFAQISAALVVAVPLISTLVSAFKVISSVATVVSGVATTLSTVFAPLGSAISFASGEIGATLALIQEFGLAEFINVFFPQVTSFFQTLGTIGGASFGLIAIAVASLVAFVTTKFDRFKELVGKVWQTMQDTFNSVKGTVMSVVDSIKASLKPAIENIQGAFERAKSTFEGSAVQTFLSRLIVVLAEIGEFIVDTLIPIFQLLFQSIGTHIKFWLNIVGTVVNFVINLVSGLITGIIDMFSGLIQFISGVFTGDFTSAFQGLELIILGVVEIIYAVFDSLLQFVVGIFTSVYTFFLETFTNIGNALINFLTYAAESIANSPILAAADALNQFIRDKFFEACDFVMTTWSGIVAFFQGIWDSITSIFNDVGTWFQGVFQSAADIISGIFNGIVSTIKSAISTLIGGVNSVIEGINSIDVDVGGVQIGGFNIPKIPKLALGGVVTSPTQALIGENGAEAIVPLENNTQWLSSIVSMLKSELTPTTTGRITPVSSPSLSSGTSGASYLTNNTSSSTNTSVDNSITFSEGAIQIVAQNSSDEEAMRLAKKIMSIIKRQGELDRMMKYT